MIPLPTPSARPPALTLIGQRTAVWLFWSGALAVALVWASEMALGVIMPSDRVAYPMLLLCFVGVAVFAARRPDGVQLAQRLAVGVIQVYLVVSAWMILRAGPQLGSTYTIATLAPWMIAAQLFLFASWSPRVALGLALLSTVLTPLPLLGMHDPAVAPWRAETGTLLLNTALAECLSAAVLFGLARQLQRLIGLADADAPRTLTVDELVRRRHAERQRARLADDQASRASQALASQEAELHAVLEAFPGMVAWSDERGIYEYANRNFTALYNLQPEQVIGRSLADIIGPERAAETFARRQNLASAGRPLTFERHMTHPLSGEPVDMLVTHFVLPARTPGGSVRFCQLAMDITDRKRAEAALVTARDVAERASRAKSEFLSRMSHELRTPMNAVLGFGQLLEMDQQLGPRHLLHVREILRAGRHLLALIDEVLDLARVEAGRIDIELQPIALAPLVEECLALVRPLAQGRGITLAATVPSHAQVRADTTRLRQVLLNLLSNAIKYNRDAGEVQVDAVEPDDATAWRLTVADTGPGIAAADQSRLFEPFNRLGAQGSGVPGIGIGLVITRRLVEAMGGRIGLDAPPGLGCRFWVELPASADGPVAAS